MGAMIATAAMVPAPSLSVIDLIMTDIRLIQKC